MKQYRLTSGNFVPQGEAGYDDAVMDSRDLAQLKKLAGLPGMVNEEAWGLQGEVGGNMNNVPNTDTSPISPIGSNITITAQKRNELLDKYHARPGSDLWFLINFTKPYLNGSLEEKIEDYFKQHPDERPKDL
jgi:hypothetical protein